MASPLGIYFLDVGQGDCSFVMPPSGAILFDCNDCYVADRFVVDHGITHLDAAIVSHLDIDHIRGMLAFLQGFLSRGGTVRALYLGIDRDPGGSLGEACSALLDQGREWDAAGTTTLCSPTRDLSPRVLSSDGAAGWNVDLVLPYYGTQLAAVLGDGKPNNCSAVLRVTYGGTSVLIGGDAPLSSWARLDDGLVKARLIRTPHHGGQIRDNGGELTDLYKRIGAKVSVFSVGTNNKWQHPEEDHVAAAGRGGACRVLCTQLTGRCHAIPDERLADGLARTGEVGYAYRHHVTRAANSIEVPCAGSVTVTLDSSGSLSVAPARDGWHDQFVATLDTPMCMWT